MSDEGEYEVESVSVAKLEKKRGKAPPVWKYRVRWKGYSPDDDTWEPQESFEGSEEIIEHFWERAQTNGRDYRDISLFRPGEEFLPIGPPRKKKIKRKSFNKEQFEPTDTSHHPPTTGTSKMQDIIQAPSGKRRRESWASSTLTPDRPAKRSRETAFAPDHDEQMTQMGEKCNSTTAFSRISAKNAINPAPAEASSSKSRLLKQRHQRSPSIEIVPDSDEENALPPNRDFTIALKNPEDPENLKLNKHSNGATLPEVKFSEASKYKNDNLERSSLPFHRARISQPLVKTVEEPGVIAMEGAISVKARLMGKKGDSHSNIVSESSTSPAHAKPGPGRSSFGMLVKNKSSLLTVEKGVLKTKKGKYHKEPENDRRRGDVEIDRGSSPGPSGYVDAPPSSRELLQLAGWEPSAAEALPDFEGEPDKEAERHERQIGHNDAPDDSQAQADGGGARNSYLTDNLLPTPTPTPNTAPTVNAFWKRPTIFGPLGSGSDFTIQKLSTSENSHTTCPFSLILDSSVSVPVRLTDILDSERIALDSIIGNSGPPGKFYSPEAAFALISALRTGGPSAKLVIDETASKENRKHFDSFCARLKDGDLFLAMAGVELLGFCSSSNDILAQRLNFPLTLINSYPGSVLVTRVSVENYSIYADLVAKADNTRWLQYYAEKCGAIS